MSKITINGRTFQGNNITVVNDNVVIDGKTVDYGTPSGAITVHVDGDVHKLECHKAEITGDVYGNVDAHSLTCDTIGGNVDAHKVTCEYIKGDVDAHTVKTLKKPKTKTVMKNTFKGRLSFEYELNHKNWGFIDDDEPFEQFYEGNITALFSPDYPKTIGVFELVVYELDKAKKFKQFDTLIETIGDLSDDYTSRFVNIKKVINDYYLDFKGSDKVIYLKNVIIHPDYRGSNVLDELIKSIYITHYTKNSLYLLNSFPVQVVKEELEYYFDDFYMDILDGHNSNTSNVKVGDYFKLNDLPQEYDEMIDYKLFARMQKLNFKQFDNTHYFFLEKEEDIMKLFKDDYEKVSNS